MKHKLFIVILFLILGVLQSNAQDKYMTEKYNADFELGEDYFNGYAYKIAIKYFKKAYDKDTVSNIIKFRLAQSYYRMRDMDDAEYWCQKLLEDGYTPTNEQIYTYIDILASNKHYDEASYWFNKLPASDSLNPKTLRAKEFLQNYKYQNESVNKNIRIYPVNINTPQADYAPTYYQTGLIITSGRPASFSLKKIFKSDQIDFVSIYYAERINHLEFEEPEVFSKKIKSGYHEGPACFFDNDTKIMFTKSSVNDRDVIGKKRGQGLDGETNLKLYMADIKDGNISNVQEFEYNSENFSTGHPTISADGQRLIFSSNRPDSDGGTDLYISFRVGEYSWSPPRNLGPKINSIGKELFPYLHGNVLYFASDGLQGSGGLDVFKTTLVDNKPTEIINLGYPINSEYDDFGMCTNDGITGYVSTNRGHPLNDDIYYIEYKPDPPPHAVNVLAYDSTTMETLTNTEVRVIDTVEVRDLVPLKEIGDSITMFVLDTTKSYKVMVGKEGYFTKQVTFSNTDSSYLDKFWKIPLVKIQALKPIKLDNIYYDFDKAELRDTSRIELNYLIDWLELNPKVKIEIRAHTDNIGNANYNLDLSQRRAQSVVNYLVESGIDSTRLIAKGFGETKPVVTCPKPSDCTKEQHQLNRRTEIVVLEEKEEEEETAPMENSSEQPKDSE